MNISSCINVNNLNDLLKGFFGFYSNFEFSGEVAICTRSAQVVQNVDKTELSKISQFINIQDPFDLSHNLAANISKNTVERFKTECRASNELLTYSSPPKKSATKCWGLILLMTKKSLPILTTSKTTPASNLVEKSLVKLKISEDENELPKEITVQKAIDFVIFLFKHCLLFEQISEENLFGKKRKLKSLNQICDRVDLLELNCSPKRLKVNNQEQSNTYVCVLNESNNNNSKDNENEDPKHQEVASYEFCIKNNTWQGRRAKKREMQQTIGKMDNIELEKLTSEKLVEIHANQPNLDKKINFRVLFTVNEAGLRDTSTSAESSFFQIKFDLLDEVQSQSDLINFSTLVHFLGIYINNSHEKLFNQWIQQNLKI